MSDRPTVDDTPAEVEAIFNSLPARLRHENAADWSSVTHFDIVGADKPHWTVTVTAGTCTVEEGLVGEPTCQVRMKEQTYIGVETGKMNPTFAFMRGRIRVSNVSQMRKYDKAFWKLFDK